MNNTIDKKTYIEKEQLSLIQYWISLVLGPGTFVIISLSLLDYLVTPENLSKFLVYRIVTASIIGLLYFLNKLKAKRSFQISLVIISIIVVSGMVELMILSFGGHQSPYYAGMIIIFIFVLGFLPFFSLRITVSFALLTYFIYLAPILIFDEITNIRIFYNNNMFLFSAIAISVLWRHYNDAILFKKISLEYDLAQEKEQLADYSSHLETVVQDRTKELRKSETMLQTLQENANDGIILMDKNGIILKANRRANEIHGFEGNQMLGMSAELLEIEKNKIMWNERMNRLVDGEALIYETEHYRKDGDVINLEVSSKAIAIGNEVYIQSIHRDTTEKKRLQTQLLHSQKMESIGTLAGGIAHDFNNILTSILGFTDLILDSSDPSPETAKRVRVIEASARKGSSLVSKLLSFARRGSIEAVPFDANPIIEDAVTMLSRVIPKNIHIRNNLNHMMPPVIGDANQIEQILMNLIINARDAMPQGGEIIISSDFIELGPDAIDIGTDVRQGMFVRISVSDTGTGIEKKHLDRIFEPFYSTKEVGQGTGLGLAMVYGIVKEHSGYVTVNSEVGKGTTFNIYLPASPAHVAAKHGMPSQEQLAMQEEIMVIDDEIPVLEFIRQFLLKEGFDAKVFDSPLDAIEYYKEHSDRVGLVITDVVMPAMDGNRLISTIKSIKPDEKIIATTGFGKLLENIKIDGLLKKPFQGPKMVAMVRQILSREKKTP